MIRFVLLDLDDTILHQVKTRRLQIEDDEWFCEIKFHEPLHS